MTYPFEGPAASTQLGTDDLLTAAIIDARQLVNDLRILSSGIAADAPLFASTVRGLNAIADRVSRIADTIGIARMVRDIAAGAPDIPEPEQCGEPMPMPFPGSLVTDHCRRQLGHAGHHSMFGLTS